MRCALCGKPLSRLEIGKYWTTLRNGTKHPICKDCDKQNVQKGIQKGVKEIFADQAKLKKLKEQVPPKPRKTEVGPEEAVIGKQIEAIEAEMVLIRAQMAGIMETMETLGYKIEAIKEAIKSGE